VHGHLEDGELPEHAAIREVLEETGLRPERLYSIGVNPFYLRATGTVQLAVVFAAVVPFAAAVKLGPEHQRFEWLSASRIQRRYTWPRERVAVTEIMTLLRGGDAGPAEDVLRII
jgi:dATP pyrophosphohydrolase